MNGCAGTRGTGRPVAGQHFGEHHQRPRRRCSAPFRGGRVAHPVLAPGRRPPPACRPRGAEDLRGQRSMGGVRRASAGPDAARGDRAPRRARTGPEWRVSRDRRPGSGRGTGPLPRRRAESRAGARSRPRRPPGRCPPPGVRRPRARRESAWSPHPAPRCPRTRWRGPCRNRRAGSGRERCRATSRGAPRTPSGTPVLRCFRTRWCRLPRMSGFPGPVAPARGSARRGR